MSNVSDRPSFQRSQDPLDRDARELSKLGYDAVWNLGKYSRIASYLGLAWGVFIFIVLILPPNELAGKTLAALIAILLILYFARVRYRYHGPEWAQAYLQEMKFDRSNPIGSSEAQLLFLKNFFV